LETCTYAEPGYDAELASYHVLYTHASERMSCAHVGFRDISRRLAWHRIWEERGEFHDSETRLGISNKMIIVRAENNEAECGVFQRTI